MKKSIWILIAVVFCSVVVNQSFAGDSKSDPAPSGGDVPTPFKLANQKAELSNGDIYILHGEVKRVGSLFLFEVDPVRHPWLTNKTRGDHPLYPLHGDANYWSQFEDKKIELTLQADAKIVTTDSEQKYQIWLVKLAEPKVLP